MHKALREFRPDLLHVQCFGPNGVYATLASVVGRLPLVVTLQGETFMDDHEIYTESLFLRNGLRLGLRRARAVTGCSQFTLEDATRRFGLDRDKARVVFNGIDLDEVAPSTEMPPFERFVFRTRTGRSKKRLRPSRRGMGTDRRAPPRRGSCTRRGGAGTAPASLNGRGDDA